MKGLFVLTTMCILSLGTLASDDLEPKVARQRQYGPYGRMADSNVFLSNNHRNSYSNANQQYGTQSVFASNHQSPVQQSSSGYTLPELYKNHNLDGNHNFNSNSYDTKNYNYQYNNGNYHYNNDNSDDNRYEVDSSITNQFSSTGDQSQSYNNGQQVNRFSELKSNTFNGFGFDVDQQSGEHLSNAIPNYASNDNTRSDSQRLEELIRLYQDHPQEFNRKMGLTDSSRFSGTDLLGIRRSTSWMPGSGSSGKSVDVYSIFAIGMFAAFIAYVVYYFIALEGGGGGGGARLDFAREAETMLGIFEHVSNAFERWAVFEYLPGTTSNLSPPEQKGS